MKTRFTRLALVGSILIVEQVCAAACVEIPGLPDLTHWTCGVNAALALRDEGEDHTRVMEALTEGEELQQALRVTSVTDDVVCMPLTHAGAVRALDGIVSGQGLSRMERPVVEAAAREIGQRIAAATGAAEVCESVALVESASRAHDLQGQRPRFATYLHLQHFRFGTARAGRNLGLLVSTRWRPNTERSPPRLRPFIPGSQLPPLP